MPQTVSYTCFSESFWPLPSCAIPSLHPPHLVTHPPSRTLEKLQPSLCSPTTRPWGRLCMLPGSEAEPIQDPLVLLAPCAYWQGPTRCKDKMTQGCHTGTQYLLLDSCRTWGGLGLDGFLLLDGLLLEL